MTTDDLESLFDDLLDEGGVTIPAPACTHVHTCGFCGFPRADCVSKTALPLEKAVQEYVAETLKSHRLTKLVIGV